MGKFDEFKNSSSEKINELKTEFEALRSKARKAQMDRQEEIKENLEELDKLQNELEEKYTRVENFGSIAEEELSNAFFSSTEAFKGKLKEASDKLN